MRDTDGDGFVDDTRPTVWDAYEQYQGILKTVNTIIYRRLVHTWKGEWVISIMAPLERLEHILPMTISTPTFQMELLVWTLF